MYKQVKVTVAGFQIKFLFCLKQGEQSIFGSKINFLTFLQICLEQIFLILYLMRGINEWVRVSFGFLRKGHIMRNIFSKSGDQFFQKIPNESFDFYGKFIFCSKLGKRVVFGPKFNISEVFTGSVCFIFPNLYLVTGIKNG